MKKAYYDTIFGTARIIYENNILYGLSIVDEEILENEKNEFTDKVYKELNEYFEGNRKEFDIDYSFLGTEFQIKVWKVLETIPYGETFTYLDVAKKIGNPKASRAVGMACNKNHIWIIVPCHRVIGSNGKMVGYAHGVDMKAKLLEIEKK